MTLRTKTSLLLAMIVTMVLGVTGALYLRFLENALRNSISDGLETISTTAAQSIARFLDDTLKDVRVIAAHLPEKAVLEKDADAVQRYLETMAKIYPKFQNGMFLLDAEGHLWSDYPPYPEVRGKDFSFREYHQKTMREARGIIGIPYRSARTGQPVLTFTAILRGPSDEVLGLLACSVQLLSPGALGGIRQTKVGRLGYLYVFDTSRLMIIHPQDDRVLKKDVLPGINKLFDDAIGGFEGVGETVNSRGIPMLLSVRGVPGTNWILGVQQPTSEAFAPIRQARRRIIFGIIAVTAGAVLLGVLLIRRITLPLAKLRATALHLSKSMGSSNLAAAVAETEFERELEGIRSGDEIGDLVNAFKEMSQRLRQTLKSLSASARDWERTFDSVPDAIFILDRELRLVRMNRSAADLMNVEPMDAFGKHCYELMHGSEQPSASCPYLETLATTKTARAEIAGPLSDSYFEVTTVPVLDEAGEVAGCVHVAKDITARKRAEEDHHRMEAQILQTQKMEAIGTLAGGIAHDFNNLLQAVMGYAELLLLQVGEGSPARRKVEEIIRSANRGGELVRRLLTFSRKVETRRQPLQLNQEVEEVEKLLSRTLPKRIDIELRLADDLELINADPVQMEQVLMNLAVNAKDAMGGAGKLVISTENVVLKEADHFNNGEIAPGMYVLLRVSDTGHGMDEETMKHIFEPFYTTKDVGQGTGLGLAVVYGIVKSHDGFLTCQSTPGAGTTFKIYFPVPEKMVGFGGLEVGKELPGGTETILLVEQAESDRSLGTRMLTGYGYTVLTAADGETALALYERKIKEIDLVIVELSLATDGDDGFLEELDRLNPQVRFLITHESKSGAAAALDSTTDVQNSIRKPFQLHEVLSAVRHALDRKSAL